MINANKGFAIAGILCFADPANAGQSGSSVLRGKFGANKPVITIPRIVRCHALAEALTSTYQIGN